MELFIIRHGRAMDPDAFSASGQPDTERPLTVEGARLLRDAVRGLRTLADRLDVVATSPLRRARETSEIVAEAYHLTPHPLPDLAPGGGAPKIAAWLAAQPGERLALVGHEPDLGHLATYLLTGTESDFLPLKKGAVCCLGFASPPRAGAAKLRYLVTASQLTRLAGVPGASID